jgi:hypothetical protein
VANLWQDSYSFIDELEVKWICLTCEE